VSLLTNLSKTKFLILFAAEYSNNVMTMGNVGARKTPDTTAAFRPQTSWVQGLWVLMHWMSIRTCLLRLLLSALLYSGIKTEE